jgi:hypothetical protein
VIWIEIYYNIDMDREIRELERQAATGDRQALHRLLIRKIALNDFELTDIAPEVRMMLATDLLGSMTGQESMTASLLSGRLADNDFYPNHRNNSVCPQGHPRLDDEEVPGEADFYLHHLIERSNFLHPETDDTAVHFYIAEDNSQPAILDSEVEFGLLRCDLCEAVWPAVGEPEAHSGWE